MSTKEDIEGVIEGIKYRYEDFYKVAQLYCNNIAATNGNRSVGQKIDHQICHRLAINTISVSRLLNDYKTEHLLFLPIGLILRCIISDIINYHYLKNIGMELGTQSLENEDLVLLAEFVQGVKEIHLQELEMFPITRTHQKTLMGEFKELFPDVFESGSAELKVKNKSEIRSQDDHQYFKSNKLSDGNFLSETKKIKASKYSEDKELVVLFRYFSLFHHFTTASTMFYGSKYNRANNMSILLRVIKQSLIAMSDIVTGFDNNTATITELDHQLKTTNDLIEIITNHLKEPV
ncbi:hypothetical protein [Chryseolinea soli]|uniref:Uncharacterized protein n=1 Tax=Chryseolinea soli TaxID=2321403 RepID=A0A385SS15_9BACT|nr:hypothetical protein [Chryseolinea soli]AYB32947.1 hypothetical protein D4L85_21240 [Chryseolinea soli]